jgi:Zn-dependent protease/predicted transcriptional regulator
MRSGSFRLFRMAGIDVRVHVSWFVVFGLITWSLADQYYPTAVPGLPVEEAWPLGAVSAILLFGSVLVHELAHSLVARARGLEAHSITLFIFGGVSTLRSDAPRPSTEFIVSIVGPLTSFGLALACFVVATGVEEPRLDALFGYLALVNGLLGAFNLVPGFPLDGGRVLRAIVWDVTGDARRALEVAVTVGQIVGYGFMVGGFVWAISGELLSGIWIAAIGWFLQGAGAASLQSVRIEQSLGDVRVRDILRADTTTIPADASVAELIEDYLLPGNRRALPVSAGGKLVGMVSLSDIRAVPPTERASMTVGAVMGGRGGVITVRPDTPLSEALQAMLGGDFEQVPVAEGERLVGVVTRADVVRQFQLREALHLGRGRA